VDYSSDVPNLGKETIDQVVLLQEMKVVTYLIGGGGIVVL